MTEKSLNVSDKFLEKVEPCNAPIFQGRHYVEAVKK